MNYIRFILAHLRSEIGPVIGLFVLNVTFAIGWSVQGGDNGILTEF